MKFIRLGIDIGGTFTDFVVSYPNDGRIETFKLLSTPSDPSQAVLRGLERILSNERIDQLASFNLDITHGSTVATNALLERRGAKTALETTRGFRDVLAIGRQNRPVLYDLLFIPASILVPSELRYEVDERVGSEGQVITPLNPVWTESIIPELHQNRIESVAVCFLFSFLHPEHESLVANRLRQEGWVVSASHEILPEFREYERMSTTVVNAYVSPVLDRYLANLEDKLPENSRLRIMQSNGGVISAQEARRHGVACVLSGPAGGVIGAQRISLAAGFERVISFDMGGTSTDVSLFEGHSQITTESEVGSLPVRIPMLDIHTIGAGGGSIAMVDTGGALRVGPQSAGAIPGPACYAQQPDPEADLPTVTDANLVLGRLQPDFFMGGKMQLDPIRSQQALMHLGAPVGMSAIQAALGVIEVANAHMEHALRLISVERGHDPRRFILMSFGGAGGLHAIELAHRVGIPQVLVSPYASVLSAFGMLCAEVVKDFSQTVMLPGSTPLDEIAVRFDPLVIKGQNALRSEGIPQAEIELQPSVDMRYQGQSYELNVPWEENGRYLFDRFHAAHRSFYGYAQNSAKIEIVTLRLRAIGKIRALPLPRFPSAGFDPAQSFIGYRAVVLGNDSLYSHVEQIPLYKGETLLPGNRITGPALVLREDTSIFLGEGDRCEVDPFLNLLIE